MFHNYFKWGKKILKKLNFNLRKRLSRTAAAVGSLMPLSFSARTRNRYSAFGLSPLAWYDVVGIMLAILLQSPVGSSRDSTMYITGCAPWDLEGTCAGSHERRTASGVLSSSIGFWSGIVGGSIMAEMGNEDWALQISIFFLTDVKMGHTTDEEWKLQLKHSSHSYNTKEPL